MTATVTVKELAKLEEIKPGSMRKKLIRKGFDGIGVNDEVPTEAFEMLGIQVNGHTEKDEHTDKPMPEPTHEPPKAETTKDPEPGHLDDQPEVVSEYTAEKKEPFDLGKVLIDNPSVIFLFAMTMLAIQAWIFASLQSKVYAQITLEHSIPFPAVFVAGMLFESSALLIAARTGKEATVWIGSDKVSVRSLWIFSFAFIQVITDLSFFGLFGNLSDLIGQIIIALSIPFGIAAYSTLYFKN